MVKKKPSHHVQLWGTLQRVRAPNDPPQSISRGLGCTSTTLPSSNLLGPGGPAVGTKLTELDLGLHT